MNTIGQRIKYLRDGLSLSQQEVANKTGISRGNISNYEKDRVSPAADTIIAFTQFFQVSADWLLTGKGEIQGGADGNIVRSEEFQSPAVVEDFNAHRSKSLIHIQATEEESEIISMYRDFSIEDKEFVKSIITFKYGQIKQDLKKKGGSSISLHGEKVPTEAGA